jgi:hypothetical protein
MLRLQSALTRHLPYLPCSRCDGNTYYFCKSGYSLGKCRAKDYSYWRWVEKEGCSFKEHKVLIQVRA